MKSLFLLMLMGLSSMAGLSQANMRGNQGLDMHLDTELVFEEMVKVYDYEGNLLKEFQLADVVNNKISLHDHFLLEQSDFAFDYLGDYYYFSEEAYTAEIN